MAKRVKIPGRLESAETGNIVTGADAVMDDAKGKTQVVINSEVDAAIISLAQGKQDALTFDSAPTEGSPNPVTSAGVYTADKVLSDAIEAILLLIPSAASALNKLVDMQTMNSSIATATASFKGTYNLVSDLHLGVDATHEQIGAALDVLSLGADNNDYAFVQVPNSATAPTEIRVTERYKFNGTNWLFEYDLNNSGFTQGQWNAINSGVTSLLVSKLSNLPTNDELTTLLAGKQDNLTFDDVPTAGSPNPVKSGGVYARNNEIVALINALDAAKQDVLTFDNAPVEGSPNPVKSGGVYTAISAVQAAIVALDAEKQNVLTFDSTPTLGSPNPVTSSGIKTELNRIDGNITTLNDLYEALTQSALVVVQPSDTWPVASPATKTIYRVVDRVNTPPQYYSDYMWNGTAMVLMATYENAIDDEPTVGSNNLAKSGGIVNVYGEYLKNTVTSSSFKWIIAKNIKAGEYLTIKLKFGISATIIRIDDTGSPSGYQHLVFNEAVTVGSEYTIEYTASDNIETLYMWTSYATSTGDVEIVVTRGVTANIQRQLIADENIIKKLESKANIENNMIVCENPLVVDFDNVSGQQPRRKCDISIHSATIFITYSGNNSYYVIPNLTFQNVDYEYGALYAKIPVSNPVAIDSIVFGSMNVNGDNYINYDNDYVYIPFYVHSRGRELYNVGQITRIKELEDEVFGIEKTLNVDVSVGQELSVALITEKELRLHKKYLIHIQSNEASFSVLAITKNKDTGTSDRLYWDEVGKNSTIDIEYVHEDPNVYNIFAWCVSSAVLTSGTMNCKIEEPGVNKHSYIIVDKNGYGDYSNLQDAMDNAGDTAQTPKTIIVLPGKYEMPTKINESYKANNRYLSIIGTDKNNCILYNKKGNYADMNNDDSCIQIAGNVYIANLTIISTAEEYVQEGDNRKMSYCIHLDMTAPENTVCEINNCILKDDHFCCIGIGLRTNYTVKIVDCELDCTIDAGHTPDFWGAIFCHDGDGATGTQKLILKNNVIRCNNGYAARIYSPFNGIINTDFFMNVCDKEISKDNKTILSDLCFGNNKSSMNYQ